MQCQHHSKLSRLCRDSPLLFFVCWLAGLLQWRLLKASKRETAPYTTEMANDVRSGFYCRGDGDMERKKGTAMR